MSCFFFKDFGPGDQILDLGIRMSCFLQGFWTWGPECLVFYKDFGPGDQILDLGIRMSCFLQGFWTWGSDLGIRMSCFLQGLWTWGPECLVFYKDFGPGDHILDDQNVLFFSRILDLKTQGFWTW